MKRKKLLALLGLVVAAVVGLWIAGPPPMQSGVYVEAVTGTSAILSMVDGSPRRLVAKIWEPGATGDPVVVAEDEETREHHIQVDGLKPGTRHEFTLEVDGVPVDGGSFRTAPVDPGATVRFAAVGDSGQMPWWHNMHRMGWSRLRPLFAWTQTTAQWRIADWIGGQDPQFFLHLGDMVYWRQVGPAYEEGFFRPFAGMLRDTALYTLPGNHDIPRDGSRPPFESLFRNPSPPGVGRPARNYTAVWGGVRLVVFDVIDPDWREGKAYAWLDRTLAAATEPWLVVATHVPCFSVYAKRSPDPARRDELWKLFCEHGVDLVLSGDDHHYVRFAPQPADGPVQVTVGTGGKSLYKVEDDPRIAARAELWAFVVVEAKGLELDLRCLGSLDLGGDPDLVDSFRLDRRTGPLPKAVHPERRRRILELRR